MRKGARSAREPVGAWRASHAMLWFLGAGGYTTWIRRCRRFRRYRSAPAGRRQSRCAKRRQPPRRVMARRRRAGGQGKVEVWKLGCLEVWLSRCRGRFGPLGLHALFSVLQGAKAPFPCRGVGQRPTSNRQSVNLPSSQSPLCSLCPFERFVIKTHRQSSCTFVVLRVLRVCPAGLTFHILPTLRPSRACRAFCSLFSVLCSLGWR